MSSCCTRARWPRPPPLRDITGSRLWHALKALDDFGLIDLDTSGQGLAAVPVARLHPLVRDTSRPAAGPGRLAFLELAVRLLGRAAHADELACPKTRRCGPSGSCWSRTAPWSLSSLASEPDCPDDAVEAAAYAAYMAARFQAEQGFHAAAEAEYRDVLAAPLRVLGPDHPDTLATRHQIAGEMAARGDHAAAEAEYRDVLAARAAGARPRPPGHAGHPARIAEEMAARGDHAAAEAEYRDVLAARLRVLGPDHPSTLATRHCIAGEMAARGEHAAAEAEYRDVLAAELRVLGPDHPATLATRHSIALGDGRAGGSRRGRGRVPGRARRQAAGARPRPPVHANDLELG